jgi:hypothetical protein
MVPSEENNKIFGQPKSFVPGDAPDWYLQFIEKNTEKYAATGGWGYSNFDKDLKPLTDEKMMYSCYTCHKAVEARDTSSRNTHLDLLRWPCNSLGSPDRTDAPPLPPRRHLPDWREVGAQPAAPTDVASRPARYRRSHDSIKSSTLSALPNLDRHRETA